MERHDILKRTIDILNKDISTKIDIRDISLILNQLSVMTSTGISIHNALEIVIAQKNKSSIQKILERIQTKITSGISFGEAISDESFENSKLLAAMIKAGELSGNLDVVLSLMSEYYMKKSENDRKFKSALIYPAILMMTSFVVLGFILTFVFPTFLNLFEGAQRELPLSTKVLIGISEFLTDHGIKLFIGVIICILSIIFLYRKNEKFKFGVDKTTLKIPILGRYIKYNWISNTSTIFAILSGCGVPILNILNIIENGTSNAYIKNIFKDIITSVTCGNRLHESFESTEFFPEIFTSMIKVGEETGGIESVMKKSSKYYETELQTSMARLISVFEPLMILIMAVVVGFIVLSIAIPMFDLVTYVDF